MSRPKIYWKQLLLIRTLYTPVVFYTKDIYAAGVMYRANCYKKYIRQFQRHVEALMTGFEEEENDNDIAFEEVILNLGIDKGGYAIFEMY